jgi:hypothetical protein
MFVKLVGLSLEKFDPAPYVRSWLAKGKHGALDTGLKTGARKEKTPIGNCFGIFF